MNSDTSLKTIAVSAGDPDGIGYDLCALLFEEDNDFKIKIFGNKELIYNRSKLLGLNINKNHPNIEIIDINSRTHKDLVLNSINMAVESCKNKESSALVTLPVNKNKLSTPSKKFSGHTEYLEEIFENKFPTMMTFVSSDRSIVALNSMHLSLKEAIKKVKKKEIIKKIIILNNCLKKQLKIKHPKILITGLNPHAGENSLFGNEEELHISPAVEELRNNYHIIIDGPIPGDTAYIKNNRDNYDCIYYMYHDQALSAFKAVHFDTGVNLTLGLPIIRTSVDHGTAEDIVGLKVKISTKSFLNAINLALKLS
jgi:4-hydroxythreonine-4-phosphate dehydrogenase